MTMKLVLDRAVSEDSKVLVSGRDRFTVFVNKTVKKASGMGFLYETVEGEPIELTGVTFSMDVKDMGIPGGMPGVSSINVNAPGILGMDPITQRPILGCAVVLSEKDAARCGCDSLDDLVKRIKDMGLYGDRYAFFDDDEGMVNILKHIKDRDRHRALDREAESDYIAAKIHQEEWET